MQYCSVSGVQDSKSSKVPAPTLTILSTKGVVANKLLPHSQQKILVSGSPESVALSV